MAKAKILNDGDFLTFDGFHFPVTVDCEIEDVEDGYQLAKVKTSEMSKALGFDFAKWPDHYEWNFVVGLEAEIIEE